MVRPGAQEWSTFQVLFKVSPNLSGKYYTSLKGLPETDAVDFRRNDFKHNDTQRNNKWNATLSIMALDTKCSYADCRLCWVSQISPLSLLLTTEQNKLDSLSNRFWASQIHNSKAGTYLSWYIGFPMALRGNTKVALKTASLNDLAYFCLTVSDEENGLMILRPEDVDGKWWQVGFLDLGPML